MIVADTHALLWWIGDRQQLSPKARLALDTNPVGIAMISCFEIARLAERRRILLDRDVLAWIDNVVALPQVRFVPLTIDVAVAAARLPNEISDPIDRIIVATALHERVPLVTKDHKIIAAGVVPTLW